ncbi:MAG TPA: hypothetical protein VF530_12950 [Planctomycetota bacterium]
MTEVGLLVPSDDDLLLPSTVVFLYVLWGLFVLGLAGLIYTWIRRQTRWNDQRRRRKTMTTADPHATGGKPPGWTDAEI